MKRSVGNMERNLFIRRFDFEKIELEICQVYLNLVNFRLNKTT